jgi:hypothetical protein
MSPTSHDPIARIERLEREAADLKERLKRTSGEVHLLQWMLVVVVAAAVGVPVYYIQNGKINTSVLLDKGVSKSLEAEEFGLHNRKDQRVMYADYDKLGMPYLRFFDDHLNLKMALYMTDGLPEVTLYNGREERASFHLKGNGEAVLELHGDRKKGGVVLSTAGDGTPKLRMTDASGKVVFEAPTPGPGQAAKPAGSEDEGRGVPDRLP